MKTLIYFAITLIVFSACQKEETVVKLDKSQMVGKWVLDSCVNIKTDGMKYIFLNTNHEYLEFDIEKVTSYDDNANIGGFFWYAAYDLNVSGSKGIITFKTINKNVVCETCIGGYQLSTANGNEVDTVWVNKNKFIERNSRKIWPETEDYYYTKQ